MVLERSRGFIYGDERRGMRKNGVEMFDWIIIDFKEAMLACISKLEGQFDAHQHLE